MNSPFSEETKGANAILIPDDFADSKANSFFKSKDRIVSLFLQCLSSITNPLEASQGFLKKKSIHFGKLGQELGRHCAGQHSYFVDRLTGDLHPFQSSPTQNGTNLIAAENNPLAAVKVLICRLSIMPSIYLHYLACFSAIASRSASGSFARIMRALFSSAHFIANAYHVCISIPSFMYSTDNLELFTYQCSFSFFWIWKSYSREISIWLYLFFNRNERLQSKDLERPLCIWSTNAVHCSVDKLHITGFVISANE